MIPWGHETPRAHRHDIELCSHELVLVGKTPLPVGQSTLADTGKQGREERLAREHTAHKSPAGRGQAHAPHTATATRGPGSAEP